MTKKFKSKHLLIIVLIALIVCLFPFPCSYHRTITMTKVDKKGSTVSTVDVQIAGKRTYSLILGEALRSIEIKDLEGLSIDCVPFSDFSVNPLTSYLSYTRSIVNVLSSGGHQSYGCTLRASPDRERLCIYVETNRQQYHFLYAKDDAYTTEQLLQYFGVVND